MRHGEKHDDILTHLKRQQGDHEGEVPANGMEQRDFGVGAQILRDLGLGRIILLSNTPPRRRVALDGYGLEIVGYEQL